MIIFSLILLFFSYTTQKIKAAELITNGGFESATFAGWTVSASTGNGWYPWQVTMATTTANEVGVTSSQPLFGSYSAWNGFCCNATINPEFIYQDVAIPAAQTASFQWSEKIQSNLSTYCSTSTCGSNIFRAQILNTSNTVLQTLYTVTASPGTMINTGWQTQRREYFTICRTNY